MSYLFRRNTKVARILVLSAIISLFVLLIVISNINSKTMPLLKPHLHDNITWCYKPSVRNSIRYFDDIADSPKQPQHGKSIFFHETTCSTNGIVELNSKCVSQTTRLLIDIFDKVHVFDVSSITILYLITDKRVQLSQPLFEIQIVIFLCYSLHLLDYR